MFRVLLRDWILFRWSVVMPMALLILFFLLVQNIEPEGFFVMGGMLVIMPSLMVYTQEDRSRGYILNCSLPGDRRQMFAMRFLSLWLVLLLTIAFMIVAGAAKYGAIDGDWALFEHYLTWELIFSYLWVGTVVFAVLLPVLLIFLGRSLNILVAIGLVLNLLLGMFFFVKSSQHAGPDIGGWVRGTIRFLYSHHDTGIELLVSMLILVAANYGIYRLCQFIFLRRDLN